MGTADISMDYGSMENLKTQVTNLQSDFSELQKNLSSLVSSLDGQWEGAAQKEFATAYSKLEPKLGKISDMLGAFASAVESAASDEATTENSTSTSMKNLSF
jgi:WXG100 family type VII secretion target